MGAKKKTLRVVLDTNVLVSALILKGRISGLVGLWRMGRITPVLSRETFDEFRRVLEYPKFSLSKREIQGILQQEILPFFEVVEHVDPVAGVCRDPDDDKFIACAASGKVAFLVSGDKDLRSLGKFGPVRILTPDQLLAMLDR
jgi:putative PIN family toxin of toxin-antitoxin system